MAVIVHVVLKGVSKAEYDAVRSEAAWLERDPEGGLAHLTWWEGSDCHNLDAWESDEVFGAFVQDRLEPAMAAAGVAVEPEVTFHPAHEVFAPNEIRRTV
jgi:hypothetical protein